MLRRNVPSLKLETLEARDVPAIMLDGMAAGATLVAGQPPTLNGGTVTMQEVAFATTDPNVVNQQFSAFVMTTRSATANDTITFALNGNTLSITCSDGIFVRFTANGGMTFFHNRGNTLDIPNVTGLAVNLQLGGNDSVTLNGALAPTVSGGPGNDTITDNTTLGGTLNGDDGDDTITVNAGAVNPLLLQLLQQPGGLNPAFIPFLIGMSGPAKALNGGTGNDTLTVTGSASNFIYDGGDGDDRINGPTLGFVNNLKGGAGNDTIIGGMGLDILDGGAGFDILFGFGGNDFIIALDGGPDFVLELPGDIVFADPTDV